MIESPILPDFPYWEVIAQTRKIIDGTTRKRWYLPDLIHYMEIRLIADQVHFQVIREGYNDVVLETKISVLCQDVSGMLNIAVVLAEKQFCREDAPFINKYRAGF